MKEKKRFSASTVWILRIHLPILTLSLVTLLLSYLTDRATDPLLATRYHSGMLEYIFASLAITVGGCLLSELVNRDMD